MEKNADSVHFQYFNPFFFIFMANYSFKKCWCVHFLRCENVNVLYTHLSDDNYGLPLTRIELNHLCTSNSEYVSLCLCFFTPLHSCWWFRTPIDYELSFIPNLFFHTLLMFPFTFTVNCNNLCHKQDKN